ncbi:MAG: ABC transporter permease [Pirellulales bacterium]|nr:ABC transporter permease [Pirellulales bacterium]
MVSSIADRPAVRRPEYPVRPAAVAGSLARRELVRFFRQRNRVFGALAQPTVFWILFGAGLGPTFHLPGIGGAELNYREFFFPGTVVLILLFTAIFTSISIIEDRREGFLQSVLVAPIPRWSMVVGKLLGGTAIAFIEGFLFLLLSYTTGITPGPLALLASTLFMFLVAFALAGLGFVFAWRTDSTQGFHAVMSVVLFPMWLLSGSFFPAESGLLGWIATFNPLTYGVAGLRQLLYLGQAEPPLPPGLPSLTLCLLVTLAFALLTFALSCQVAGKRTTGDLL